MHTKIERHAGVPVVVITGEIDLATASEMTDSIQAAFAETGPGVIVDLSSVSYLDSSGVHALFRLVRQRPATPIAIVVPQSSVIRRVLDLVDLSSVVALSETMDEALSVIRRTA